MKRLFFFSLLLVFSLVLAAVTPGLVYAEGDIPEEPAPEPGVVEETLPEDTGSVVELLAEVGAVIAGEGGDAMPLASQAALEVICDPDPWFYCSVGCVGGKSPVYTTFAAAISNWAAKKGYGYLYVQGSSAYDIASIMLNGAGTGNPYSTMTGIVWDKTGSKPVIIGAIELSGFTKGFTMQGLTITANSGNPAIKIHNTTGTIKLVDVSVRNTGGTGIEISTHKGPVVITNVNANDNRNNGLYVDNVYWDGLKFVNAGNVTITNSAFLRNGGASMYSGLLIFSSGSILLNGVTASGNSGNGGSFLLYGNLLHIRNSVFSGTTDISDFPGWGFGIYSEILGVLPAAITLDNVILAGNEADGAYMDTGGNIILNKVYASNNLQHGVYISGSYISDSVGGKNVTVMNSTFTSNQDNNLEIHASGAVKITNLYSTASLAGSGLYIENTYAATPIPVTILGAVVNDNGSRGMDIFSKGSIVLSGITALGNTFSARVNNNQSGATGGVTINGTLGLNRFNNTFSGNGLIVDTRGNVSLASIQANGNASWGIHVVGVGSASNVSMANVEVSYNKGVTYAGLTVETTGTVVLNKVTALMNAGRGIDINNDGAAFSRLVTIISSTASGNGKEGIYVRSAGAITLSGVTASGNTLTGADLLNSVITYPQVPQGITVLRSTFDLNGSNGLYVETLRNITLTSINASENFSHGVTALNNGSTIGSRILVNGTNRFYHNGKSTFGHGIALTSSGVITISGVASSSNFTNGVYLYSTTNITASNIQVIGNKYNGVEISLNGNGLVTLTGLTALQNGTSTNYSGVLVSNPMGKVRVNSGLILGNGAYGLRLNVVGATEADLKMNAYVAPGVVVFGNDVVGAVGGVQISRY